VELEQWLGKDNIIGMDIWKKKYQHDDETLEQWFDRVSNGNKEIKQLIIDKKFLFGGRILANRGLQKEGRNVSLSNCYVIKPPEDNIESIFKTCGKLARTFSYSGGCGIDISNLRPKNAIVNNAAKFTTGSVSFMDLFSKVTETIGQNGRRGALMISISCNHPDLEDFINIKRDLSKVTSANISVRFTDDFMKAVENNENYTLRHQYSSSLGTKEVEKEISAKRLFEKFVESNWSMAEPGALFWDRIEKWNLLSNTKSFHYAGTNPCLSGDTIIHTARGRNKIKDLVGKTPYLFTMTKDGSFTIQKAERIWKTKENAEVLKVNLDFSSITCTPDHRIYTVNRGYVEAKDLIVGDRVATFKFVNFKRNENALCEQVVRSIIKLEEKEDVYDIEVPETHNFVANEIVVHNCAEEPLPAGGSCLLGSLNLAEFVKNGSFDYSDFEKSVRIATRALNDVLEEGLELHPLKEQRDSVARWKQIGLGIFGLADMLIKLRIKYGSIKSLEVCNIIGNIMINESCRESSLIAKEKGSFNDFNADEILSTKFVEQNLNEDVKNSIKINGLRNSQLLTCAPTGSLSNMFQVSGGIEPIYNYGYWRTTKSLHGTDVKYRIYTPIVKDYIEKNNLKDDSELPEFFTNALLLNYNERLRMQSVWQRHIDGAISSTLNIPHETTKEQVFKIYLQAWKSKLKGITIFRDGCDRVPILSNSSEKKELKRGDLLSKDNLIGLKRTLKTGCVDSETEYFNGFEWKKISEYSDSDMVLQYCEDGHAELVKPLEYIKRKANNMYRIKTKYGLDMVLSSDHRNVVFKYNPYSKKHTMLIKTTDEIIDMDSQYVNGFPYHFLTSFDYSGKGISLSIPEIRLCVAIFADGCFHYEKPHLSRCFITLFKERKKQRLRTLLDLCNYQYSESNIKRKGYTNFYFKSPLGTQEKTFPKEWYNCSKEQLEAIFDEVFYWDGYEKKHNQYTTNNKQNADFIQFVCTVLGKRATINISKENTDSLDKKHCNKLYRVDWTDRIFVSMINKKHRNITLYKNHDGYDYCFKVPSTMLVLRRNNKIFITGNCGNLHASAFFDNETGEFVELFLGKGSQGGCLSTLNGLARLVSLSARAGAKLDDIIGQLKSANACPSYVVRTATQKDTSKGSCCPSAIANALKEMSEQIKSMKNINIDNKIEVKAVDSNKLCPMCKSELKHTNGCIECKNCGWTKCNL